MYGVPPRKPDGHRWPTYEEKRTMFNNMIKEYCSQTDSICFVESSIVTEQIGNDKIYIKQHEVKTVIMDLKKAINPLIGIRSYTEYLQPPKGTDNEPQNRITALRHGLPSQDQSFPRILQPPLTNPMRAQRRRRPHSKVAMTWLIINSVFQNGSIPTLP